MSSVFTKIINGEIPCYKIYEDDKTMAFLDINPETPGHTLVVPKKEVDKIYELEDEDYEALMATVKKLSVNMEKVLGAHVHLLPFDKDWHQGRQIKLTPEEFEEIRAKLEVK